MKTFPLALLAVLCCVISLSISSTCGVAEEIKQAVSDTPVETKKLQPHEVRSTVSLVLTRESAAKTPAERAAAVRDLSTLYLALARDEEMARAERLKLKAKMYSRLIAVKEDLENDLKRRKEAGDYPVTIAEPADDVQPYVSGTQEARGGGAVRDYGETLVELIQHTIAPEHWDASGGPGSIVYWPNLQVLVVRASGDVHARAGGLFDGLRAAR